MNVGQYNQELLRQRQAQQQMYENEVRRRQLRAQAQMGKAGQYQQQAAATQKTWGDIGSGIGSFGSALYGLGNKNPFDVDLDDGTKLPASSSTGVKV